VGESNDRFALHPQLAADSKVLGDWPLCRLLLLNDANYPWFVLVPRRNNIREIYELADGDRAQLCAESVALSRAIMQAFGGYKLNVAALGNAVPQLHVHHVVRLQSDPAWPMPVWGKVPPKRYAVDEMNGRLRVLRAALPAELRGRLVERLE
jgi:diadenosine tetraphosphate (Ap4A) HIT family hydrolase